MRVMAVPVVVGALGMILKDLEKRLEELEIRERIKTIQTTALLRLARILRRVLKTCCHSDFREGSSVDAFVKNSQRVKEKNRISSDSCTKQCHKNQLYQSKNR